MIERENFLLLPVDENNKNVKKYNETNSSFHIFLGEMISISDISTFPRGTGSLAHVVATQRVGVFRLAAGSSLFTGAGAVHLQSPGHGDGLGTSLADHTSAQSC